MLTQLAVQNYSLVENLNLEFSAGMTVITGETGAGKSVMLNALGLALGERADGKTVRKGATRADIQACFDTREIPAAENWLEARDLQEGGECILRRVITGEGRSRAWINGRPVPLQDIKSLGGLLIDIHNQHAHQSLLNKNSHLNLLDSFAGHDRQVEKVRACHQRWKDVSLRLEELTSNRAQASARQQLLSYQIQELDNLAVAEGEVEALEASQKTLANAEHYLQSGRSALELCRDNETGNALSLVGQAIRQLGDLPGTDRRLSESLQLLGSAKIQLEEAGHELQAWLDDFDVDPEKLTEVENRLSTVYEVARKHQVAPEQLHATHQDLAGELGSLCNTDTELEALQQELTLLESEYQQESEKLSRSRRKAAKKLVSETQKQLQALGMDHCQLECCFNDGKPGAPASQGMDQLEFLISTNPGLAPGPLNKVASGGELSRISLAIQVVTAATSATPSLVFDEVDVGVGGATAEVIGNLLQQLGKQTQVLCVTHLPQVAAKGHHHINVRKQASKESSSTHLEVLSEEQKIEEIARMLGGIAITDKSKAHAREMLNLTH
jgi:DNA repair protein RecN (Recombination protein N)